MGKLFVFLTILIFVELTFLSLGIIDGTLTSQIFTAIENPNELRNGNWWLTVIGINKDGDGQGGNGLFQFLVGIGVTVGFLVTKSDTILYAPIAIALGVLATDYLLIFTNLRVLNPVLAYFVIVPVIIMYAFVISEWARGKD